MSDSAMTQGAVLVAALAKRLGASAMGRKLEITEAAVRTHASGQTLPRAGVRARYHTAYDVPVAAWETPAGATIPPPAAPPSPPARPAAPPPPAGELDARTAVVELLHVARAQLEAAQADTDVPYRERAQLITSATGLCRLLARLSGQLEVSEVAIVRSQPWARAMALVREVLQRHPAAAAELDEALTRFARGES